MKPSQPIPRLAAPAALVALVALVAVSHPSPAGAQDVIGLAVAIAAAEDGAPEILVLKPAAGRGPAAVLVFRDQDERGWRLVDRLSTHPAAAPYEGFSPSMAIAHDVLAVAAADGDAVWAAHLYRRRAAGRWAPEHRLPLDPDGGDDTPASLDMGRLMRIMQPPPRAVAADSRGKGLAAAGPVNGSGTVRLFDAAATARRTAAAGGGRDESASIDLGVSAGPSFGAGLAVGAGFIIVGDPDRGAAYVVDREAAPGPWRRGPTLAPDRGARGSGFGASVLILADEVLIGAPGIDRVFSFLRDPATGEWTRSGQLDAHGSTMEPTSEAAGQAAGEAGAKAEDRTRFGAALASAGGELWVGAAADDGGRGAVHRFNRGADGIGWRSAGKLGRGPLPAPSSFGLAMALTRDLGVVAAPHADGGRVAVYRRGAAGWSGPVWLEMVSAPAMVRGGVVRCDAGEAAGFDCRDVDLLAYLPIEALGGQRDEWVSDLWGWRDPETRREYALVGRSAGMAIVDVTDPTGPVYVGVVPARRAGPRDIKVYDDHAFFTGDGAGDHGLVVFDLRRLRKPADRPTTFEADARYDGIASAHNLVMEEETGLAIPVGASGGGNTCGGGLHMVDVTTPLEPTFLGCFTDSEGLIWRGRTHDAQCVVYRGPDAAHRGRTICFASNETALRVVDVTEPRAPVSLARATYPGLAYAHQGWLSEDQRYFYMNDELDEMVGLAERTRTLIWDIADLDDPVLVGEYFGPDGATDHNLLIRSDRMYQANYQAGFRLLDIGDPERPVEIGFFDTTPYGGNPAGFATGAWTAYPFLPSGTVLVSSMHEGLFLLRPRPGIVP